MLNRARNLNLKIGTHRKQQVKAILLSKITLRKHYRIEFKPCSKMAFHRQTVTHTTIYFSKKYDANDL